MYSVEDETHKWVIEDVYHPAEIHGGEDGNDAAKIEYQAWWEDVRRT